MKPLAVLLLLLAILAITFLALSSGGEWGTRTQPASAEEQLRASERPPRSDDLRVPNSSVSDEHLSEELLTSGGDQLPGNSTGGRVALTPASFEEKYAKYTIDQLKAAEQTMRSILERELAEVYDSKFERGDYELKHMPPGTPLEQPGAFPDGTPRPTQTRTSSGPAGLLEIKVAEVRLNEHPALSELYYERFWLQRRVAEMSQVSAR